MINQAEHRMLARFHDRVQQWFEIGDTQQYVSRRRLWSKLAAGICCQCQVLKNICHRFIDIIQTFSFADESIRTHDHVLFSVLYSLLGLF